MSSARKLKQYPQVKKTVKYPRFASLDGTHPLQTITPEGIVLYPVRQQSGGRVAFFNFSLAKEMGLIAEDHAHGMTPELEATLIDCFALTIINEYDLIHNVAIDQETLKPHSYMATRYLQLQHPSRSGTTSGDGRSIWNGHVVHEGKQWDVSSCGTGATRLSPATSIHDKFFKTGDPSVSYGCGHSDKEEGLNSLFFSEILHHNAIATERVLAVIEFPKGRAINVRTHRNLLRPSHFFANLKQGRIDALRQLTDYYIARQESDGFWTHVPKTSAARYRYFLAKMTKCFAEMAADFEDHYVFCWLDWDGDNILMDGSIIDYGSVRQFGLFHWNYRYDDVERYSTTITEQRKKAQYLVQTFAQMVDSLISGEKKMLKYFQNHASVGKFNSIFEHRKDCNLLKKIGFEEHVTTLLLPKYVGEVRAFRRIFASFERASSKTGMIDLPDGINCSAIFCMRDALRELPQLYARSPSLLSFADFIAIVRSNYANEDDVRLTSYRKKTITFFQKRYQKLVERVSQLEQVAIDDLYARLIVRSVVINKADRITGDAVSIIAEYLNNARPRLTADEIDALMRRFVAAQNLDPDAIVVKKSLPEGGKRRLKQLRKITHIYREGL